MSKYNAIVFTKSLRGGHYRAGQYHGPEQTEFPLKTFTEQQMEHLAADTDIVLLDLVPKEEVGDATVKEPPAGEAGGPPNTEETKEEKAPAPAPPAPGEKPGKGKKKD